MKNLEQIVMEMAFPGRDSGRDYLLTASELDDGSWLALAEGKPGEIFAEGGETEEIALSHVKARVREFTIH